MPSFDIFKASVAFLIAFNISIFLGSNIRSGDKSLIKAFKALFTPEFYLINSFLNVLITPFSLLTTLLNALISVDSEGSFLLSSNKDLKNNLTF